MKQLEIMREFKELDTLLGFGFNPVSMYQTFYEQHKNKFGSNKYLKENYQEKMEERYDWIVEQMNCVYESRLSYETKAKKVK